MNDASIKLPNKSFAKRITVNEIAAPVRVIIKERA